MFKNKKITITSVLLVLCFLTQFISLPYFSWYDILRYFTIVVVGLYDITKYKLIFQKKYRIINLISLLFCGLTILSAFLNLKRDLERNPLYAAIVFSASFIVFLFFIESLAEQNQIKKTLNIFFKTALLIAIVTDILIIFVPSLKETYDNYLIGTKFGVSFLHLELIVLYLCNLDINKLKISNKVILFILFILTYLISLCVQCVTGIISVLILLILLFCVKNNEKNFSNPVIFIAVQCMSFVFIFIYGNLLNIPFIKYIIVNYFEKDITLTSRTIIFSIVPDILSKNNAWLTGMGYGSSYELGHKYSSFPDTQNGILEWIWNVGVPTTIIMLLMFSIIFYVVKKRINKDNKKNLFPILAIIYMFTILEMIEVTIGKTYFGFIALLFGIAVENKIYKNANFIENKNGNKL